MYGGRGRGGGAGNLRRYFDKLSKDGDASLTGERDASQFLQACMTYDDRMELLFRLGNPKVRRWGRTEVAARLPHMALHHL
jgi:hypothetical protein